MKPISTSELQQFREDTPGCAQLIHLNNAGAALPPNSVTQAVFAWLEEEALVGGYEIEEKYADQLAETYTLGAKFLNCAPTEIAFSSSNTLAWRTAFNGLQFEPGDEILTSYPEYGSNMLAYLQKEKEMGVKVKVIPNAASGSMDLAALQSMVGPRTKLISISHIPSTTGIVQDAAGVGKIAREAGVLYFLDACQSGGQVPLDVQEIGCDVLTLTGRKYLRGPRGTGLLYVRKAVQDQIDPPFLDIRSANQTSPDEYAALPTAGRFETFEHNRALQVGWNEALKYAMQIGLDRIWQRIESLEKLLREQLATVPGVTVLDQGEVLGGIVTFVQAGKENAALKKMLTENGINVSLSPRGSAYQYMSEKGLETAVRSSVHYYNTEAEIERFIAVLKGQA